MENYEQKLRNSLLKKIDDLRQKIEKNEPCPEQEQDISLLIEIDDRLTECLGAWYY